MKIRKGNIENEANTKRTAFLSSFVAEQTDEETKIELYIRERYSMSQELALHRKKLMGVLEDGEWDAYCAYIEECIERARSEEPVNGD